MTNFDINSDSPLLQFAGKRSRAKFSFKHEQSSEVTFQDELLAGVAEVDLTPPPGMPKAGYSSNAHNGNGFRTRLRARIFYLRKGQVSLAIVQCDLLGGSAVIQHLVAKGVEGNTDVKLGGIMIGGTHTHAAPGQFLGTDFYNRFASNRSGFDARWTQFIATEITNGIVDAYQNRKRAKIAIGSKEVWGLTRNRSLHPHVQNETVEDKRLDPQMKFHAINPSLELIRIDEIDGKSTKPMGAAIIFSVHGTGIPVKDHLYHSDVWAYICGEVKVRSRKELGSELIVGAMEGSHADVAPAIIAGQAGFLEAKRVGRGIGEAAYELYKELEGDLSSDVKLGVAFKELNLDKVRTIDGVTIPDRPAVGAALVAGAKENTTPVINLIPPFKAGFPKPHRAGDPQGEKWVIGSRFLQPIMLSKNSFPRILPIQIIRIGSYAIVGMPFEITVESGQRIAKKALEPLRGIGVTKSLVSSVANEYSGYIATKEEYGIQYYEGGHTLYGPNSQAFLANAVFHLSQELSNAASGVVYEGESVRSFALNSKEFMSAIMSSNTERDSLSKVVFHDPKVNVERYYEFHYQDAHPDAIHWNKPIVSVQYSDTGQTWHLAARNGYIADDQDVDLEIVHMGQSDSGHHYRVRWYEPHFKRGYKHRFLFHQNGDRPQWHSEPFD